MAIQEAERWNMLLGEIRRSLAELDLGLKGDLTMTEPMASVADLLSCLEDGAPCCLNTRAACLPGGPVKKLRRDKNCKA